MKTLAGVARKHPQSAYAVLQKSLQKEWTFMQRVTLCIGDAFVPVEKSLWETFSPALFQVLGEGALGRGVTCLPLKQAVLVLPDPTNTAPENWTASCVITVHLVAALRGQVEYRTADHLACLQEGRTAVWKRSSKRSSQRAEEALSAIVAEAPVQGARRLQRATKTGVWQTVQPSMVNGTELGVQEWLDSLFLRYGLDPPDLPHYCDSCNAKFSICHALDCKRGGLVAARHNELRYGVADLSGKAFAPSHVRYKPLIFACCAVKRPKEKSSRTTGTTVWDNTPPPEDTEHNIEPPDP